MKSTITFFPVDNGDMTLIKLSDKTTILTDINLRESAEDEEDPAFDAVKGLRDRLEKDDDVDNGSSLRLTLVRSVNVPVNVNGVRPSRKTAGKPARHCYFPSVAPSNRTIFYLMYR
jgi:hypothetical protein